MGKAAEQDLWWVRGEYFDLLNSEGSAESLKKMIEYAAPLAESGNREMQGRMGRAYRDGRGVEKDIQKAIYWMGKALENEHTSIIDEYLSILSKLKSSQIEMYYTVANEWAIKENVFAQGHLARAYRDGKGTLVDLNSALFWMKKAADNNLYWAKDEYNELKDTVAYCSLPTSSPIIDNDLEDILKNSNEKELKKWILNNNTSKKFKDEICLIYKSASYKKIFSKVINSIPTKERVVIMKNMPAMNCLVDYIQKAGVKLLYDFTEICKKNNLEYFMSCGSLLGTIRNNGYIPWDDDLDVFMKRTDIIKLKNILEDSDVFVIKTYYQIENSLRYYKFELKKVHFFIDIFPLEEIYINDLNEYWKKRKELITERKMAIPDLLHKLSRTYPPQFCLDYKTDELSLKDKIILEKYFDKYNYIDLNGKNAYLTVTSDMSSYFFDKMLPVKTSEVYPLLKFNFEGIGVYCPSNYDKILKSFYGNYLEMPSEFQTHYAFHGWLFKEIKKYLDERTNYFE